MEYPDDLRGKLRGDDEAKAPPHRLPREGQASGDGQFLRACSRCGGRSTVVGKDGECLKCLLERRKQAQKAIPEAGVPF